MALLEMGANVQCDGYFPGYYSARDLVFESERIPWTSSDVNSELKNELHYIGSLPVSSPCNLIGYNKELLKQTILKHEAIFRDQVHELHRIYHKQKELMEEINRNQSYKHDLRLETSSWSASSLSSKNGQKICYSANLPWSTARSLPPGASLRENSKKIFPPPVPVVTEESFKDSKPSESKYRKVGKKVLDLQLPANEYIDSEESECLENGKGTDMHQVLAYSLNGSSKVVCGNGEKAYGVNSNAFAGLNIQFKIEEATSNSYDSAAPAHNRNNAFYDLSRTTKLSYQNFPNDVIWNSKKRKDPENFSGNSLLDQRKMQEQMYRGQSGGTLDSFSKVICTGKQSVSIEPLRKNMEQFNDPPYFHPLNQVSEPWSVRKFSSNGSQVEGFISNGSLGPTGASRACAQYPFVLGNDKLSSGISPSELWKTPVSYCGQSSTAVPAAPFLSSSASLGQSSKTLMGISGFTQDGKNLDGRNLLLCSRSKPLDLPSISSNDPNRSAKHDSLDSDKLQMKGSKDVGTLKNLNLNIAPAGYFDITALQSIQIPRKENNLQDSSGGLPWLKEKPVFKGNLSEGSKIATRIESVLTNSCNVGGKHDLELKKTEESDLSAGKILALHGNERPQMSSDHQSSHAFQSFRNQMKSQSAEGIEKKCMSDGKSKVPLGEYSSKNEQKKHESLAGIIDLNSCMIEDENMLMDVDLQAPISPENKECSPPRGESDENQLEMPFQLAGQEDPEVQEERARVAAEALVTISGFVDDNGLKKTTCSSSESSPNPLHWFAEIVSTAADHPENNAGFSGSASNLDNFSHTNMDYFEFMTLNLTETTVLDCCYSNTIGQTEQVGGSTLPTQTKKGRPNRGRWRKDFQSQILPSLASLSRYEVTEDLQIIGGLVAAGTPSETGSLRSAGKNVSARGRRRSGTSVSNNTELHLNFKELTSMSGLGIEKRCLISWGKICRKRRGKRLPTTKPLHILNQVYN